MSLPPAVSGGEGRLWAAVGECVVWATGAEQNPAYHCGCRACSLPREKHAQHFQAVFLESMEGPLHKGVILGHLLGAPFQNFLCPHSRAGPTSRPRQTPLSPLDSILLLIFTSQKPEQAAPRDQPGGIYSTVINPALTSMSIPVGNSTHRQLKELQPGL